MLYVENLSNFNDDCVFCMLKVLLVQVGLVPPGGAA